MLQRLVPLVLVLAASVPGAVSAELISNTFAFKRDVVLEVGEQTGSGLRLDSVRFRLPATVGGSYMRAGGLVSAEIAVSNAGERNARVGLAVALYDEAGRLLGVASGSLRLKPSRQRKLTVIFDDVNGEAFKADRFQISLEARP